MISTFDIFSGRVDKDAVWVETVEGLGNAYELMTKVAAEAPAHLRGVGTKHLAHS